MSREKLIGIEPCNLFDERYNEDSEVRLLIWGWDWTSKLIFLQKQHIKLSKVHETRWDLAIVCGDQKAPDK